MPHPALLLTDVVDSTALNQRLGDARMAELWTSHDRVARDLLATHGGRELGRTDGFLMTFDDPSDAVRYARAYHAALAPLGMQARAGLHVGPLTVRKNLDADVLRGAKPDETAGFAISVAARVMSIAGAGQTLASAEAVAALDDRSDSFVVVSHGHWQLKGVVDPLEVLEVGVRGEAPFAPPKDAEKAWRVQWSSTTWIPAHQMRHRLPAERDAFVGRRDDLVDLVARIDAGARLVSLLGIGGTGKTRLALRYAWITLGSWPGGAWFCDLADARDVNGIAYAVATALDVPLGKANPIAHLSSAIAARGRCLLILDNFEQVAGCAGETLGRWLDAAPAATFVATTRELLHLPGEVALDLAPLGSGDAIALFDARAHAADRHYVADVEAVTRLVDMLDGLPLAIELAAARVRLMSVDRLLERMRERFALLASSGGRVDRHATLRATIDWSWNLLSDDEKTALAELAVFEGGFTLDAAEAVLSTIGAMDTVQALVDKSLVRSGTRFQQLVSVQAYASEKLDETGGRADAEARHGVYFAKFGTDEALAAIEGRKSALALDLENLLVAARRAIARGDPKVARCAALGSWKVLRNRGPLATGLALLRSAFELPGHDAISRGALELAVGIASRRLGHVDDARIAFDHVLEVAQRAGDPRLQARARYELGTLVHQMGEDQEAHDHYVAALRLSREGSDKRTEARTLNGLAAMDALAGRLDEALEQFRVALEAARGDATTEVAVMCNMGDLHYERGRIDQACALYEAACALAREHGGLRVSEATSLVRLGGALRLLGDTGRARATLEEALLAIREVGYAYGLPTCLAALSLLDANDGRHDVALTRLHEALDLAAPYPDELADVLVMAAQVHLARGSAVEARASMSRARALGHTGRVGAVIAACDALVAAAEGDVPAAMAALAEAERDPDTCAPGSEVALLIGRARGLLTE